MCTLSKANIICYIHCAILKAPGLLRAGGVLREQEVTAARFLTFYQVHFISPHLRTRVLTVQLMLHSLAEQSWVPCQLQDCQYQGVRDMEKQEPAGEDCNSSVQDKGYSLGSKAPSLKHSLCRFVGSCPAVASYPGSVCMKKEHFTLGESVWSCLPVKDGLSPFIPAH